MPHNYGEFSEVSTHKADYKRFVFGLFVSAMVHLNPGLWFIFYLQVCTEKYMQIHFLGFFLLLFFHCEGICGNSLHSYKHQCIFWLSSLLVVVCTFQAEQLFVAGHRYNKMWFFSGSCLFFQPGSCLFQVKGRLKSAFLSPLLFSPVAHRGGCDKEKGTQADC